jgi:hypothetical protein
MKYKANPVIVDAYKIVSINLDQHNIMYFCLDGKDDFIPTKSMLARITPQVGDYLVIQEDGYEYLNPKDVFQRKYSKVESFTDE